jgi:hypothetical protein
LSERIEVERLGGFAGFGGPNLKSWGSVAVDRLSAAERRAIDVLFDASSSHGAAGADEFRYRVTFATRTIEVRESRVPAVLRDCVKDELA